MMMADSYHDYLSDIEDVIEDARKGRMFILVDDEDRENEGDLIIPAEKADADAVNFMAKHGRGLICLSMTAERAAAPPPPPPPGRRPPRAGSRWRRATSRATRPPSPCRSRRARASPPASRP